MTEIPYAIVTGATRGLGRAIARGLVERGFSCISIGSSIDSIREKVDYFPTDPAKLNRSVALDLATWNQDFNKEVAIIDYHSHRKEANKRLEDALSLGNGYRLRALVNCAGVTQHSLTLRTSPDTMSRIMNVNFNSAVGLCNFVTKRQLKLKKQDRREVCIVNISSILGINQYGPSVPGTAVYSASKAALARFTQVYGQEVKSLGVTCHDIAPGLIPETDMIQTLSESAKETLLSTIGNNTSTIESITKQVMEVIPE